MNKYMKFFWSRLDESLNVSRFLHAKSMGEKVEIAVYCLVQLVIYIVLFAISLGLCNRVAKAGLAEILPSLTYSVANMISFLLTIIGMGRLLQGKADAEFMMSTPLSDFAYVCDMLLSIYGRIISVSFILCVPAIISYFNYVPGHHSVGFFIVGFLMTGVPLGGIAALSGVFITLCLAKSPRKNQIQSAISLICVAVTTALALVLVAKIMPLLNGTITDTAELANSISKVIVSNSKFTGFYYHAVLQQDIVYMILLVVSSIIWFVGFSLPLAMGYRMLVISFNCPVEYEEYEWKELEVTSVKKAIWQKEIKQLFLSQTYFLRGSISLVIGIIMAIGLCILSSVSLGYYINFIQLLCISCFFVATANTTFFANSLEGKYNWIITSAGLENKTNIFVKVLLNLIFTIPFTVIFGILLALDFQATVSQGVLMVLLPMLYAVLNAFIGVLVNLKFGNPYAETEEAAVRQGLPYILGYVLGVVLPIIVFYECFFL